MTIAAKYLKAGFHFWFRPDKVLSNGVLVDNPSKAFFDLGVCTALDTTSDKTKIELKDTRGGNLKLVAQGVTEIKEEYKGTFGDFNKKNILIIFGAGALNSGNRGAVSFTTIGENFGASVGENETVFLGTSADLDSIGNFILDNTFVPIVYRRTVSATTHTQLYTVDINYTVDTLLGTVTIIDHDDDNITLPADLLIKYRVAEIALVDSLTYWNIEPQSSGGIIEGKMRLEIGSNGNLERMIRTGRVALNVDSFKFTAEDYSTYEMSFAIVNQIDAGKLYNVQ